ncbi:Ubiquinone biosynthesis monooxygenase COQ6, mitochondrial [Galdieria sulphuraria]|uniref:Ubiquinone biosynthesis monooxygenase Coq6 n=1 Tax=Galdieria sulphuraria TaxID=130081 RepID=M2VUK4_GALSU|nr:ubiquinone biosynthesis monooxygenase Coq6 [Galdieria sulphuraria]EME26846.1 ubiquinone biosynthesis monooxygenase Coq6 [Galdieria sulphuraria]GJD12596.1 Ubiquinone biosynthesis monooxygenase COQ6, mitochondrial [Galdieria sulphuraria]|eukprot:XP_005703366.1 ubiquinone biosynthesis monooxygenase Coq6 [Galdieria sulphuraria]
MTFLSRRAIQLWQQRKLCSAVGSKNYDIIIVGGGLVGAALCAGVCQSQSPCKVALVEPHLQTFLSNGSEQKERSFPLRTSTINPASQRWLKKLKIWELLDSKEVASFARMKVWDSRSGSSIVFHSSEVGMESLGSVVANEDLLKACYRRIQRQTVSTQDKIDFFDSQVDTIQWSSSHSGLTEWPVLTLKDGNELHGRVVVAADGSNSPTRKSANIPRYSHYYQQRAVVVSVRTEKLHRTAWQRFLSTGPIALLPMAGFNISNVVWSTTEVEASILSLATKEELVEELNNAFLGTTNAISLKVPNSEEYPPAISEILSGPASFPLTLGHATEYVKERLVLIGDAAHSVHPLAGQGVNLGFADARCLLEIFENAWMTGRDLGELSLLLQYQRKRLPKNLLMLSSLHSLESIFSFNSGSVSFIRGLGMSLLGGFLPAKKAIIEFASGNSD